MTGSYRKAFVMPKNFVWSIKQYSSPNDTLILSDIEKFNSKEKEVKEEEVKAIGEFLFLFHIFFLIFAFKTNSSLVVF